ncbi:MAG: Ig-like domain repeat protein [Candidatus Peribacteraceae bacterium]|jgi:hypothetical protein|nr:Ig-like domain repeat protein [Candidatus Peribacteraceae bacterium]
MRFTQKFFARVQLFPLVISLIFSPMLSVIPVFVPMASAAVLVCTPEDASLVGYWKFDEGTGASAADTIGGNTGSIGGTGGWSASVPPSIGFDDPASLIFNGTNSVVSVGDVPALQFDTSDAFSASVWVDGVSFGSYRVIGHKIDDTTSAKRGYLFVLNAGVPETWIIRDYGAGNYLRVVGSSALSAGTWHHLAFTYDGSGVAAGVQMYVDGSAQSTTAIVDALVGSILNSAAFEIGARSLVGQRFSGMMDDARLYNAALTEAQVTRLAAPYCGADKLTPTAAVTPDFNPSTYGNSVTFTATVSGGYSPTGTVDFKDGLTTIASGVALAGGSATFATSTLGGGSHSITAVYSGDNENETATSPVLMQVVNKATLTVTADGASRAYGAANPAFTAGYSGFVNGEVLGTSDVTGSPSLTTAATPASPVSGSPYAITAGTGSLASSNYFFAFVDGLLTVTSVSTTTNTVLSAPNASIVGDPVTLTGSVSGGFGPTGNVQFLSGSVVIGTGSLTGGKTSISVIFTTVGDYQLTAHYLGDGNNDPSTSGTGTLQVVNKASPVTSTVLNAPSTSTVGDSVTLTGNVTGGFNPTGTVEFLSGSVLIGTGSIVGTSASLTYAFTVVGDYTLSARYLGDSSNNLSTSTGTVMQVVAKASPATATVLSAPNSSTVGSGVLLSATVSGGFHPTGFVDFMSGSTILGTVALTGTSATLSHTFTIAGNYLLKARYLGDASNNSSTSPSATVQVVDKALPSTSTAIGVPNSSIVGDTVLFTASVSGGYNPTGIVNFLSGSTLLGSGTILAGSATLNYIFSATGNYDVHADYLGDANNLSSSSTGAIIQVVDKFQSSVSLSLSSNLSFFGDDLSLTAIVTGFFPSGTVTFRDGGSDLAVLTLSNGSGSFTTSSLALGSHSFTAVYSGDSNNIGSTSDIAELVVVPQPPENGSGRGHNLTSYSSVVHFVLANAGGGGGGRGTVAPGAFGGQGDNVIIPRQREILCVLQRSISPRAESSLIIWMAQYMAPFFNLQPAIIEQALQDPGLCSGSASITPPVSVASIQQIMPVDAKGIPLSTNPIWNACIRNNISVSANDLTPMSCKRYHSGHYWTHPDSLITFFWGDRYRQQLFAADRQPLLTLRVR